MAFSGFSQQLGAPSKALNTCRGFHLALMLPNNQFSLRLALRRRLKPLRNLLSLKLHASEIRGALPPALFRCLNRLQHLAISGGRRWLANWLTGWL